MGGRGCEGVGARAWVRGRRWECRARASTRLAQQVHGGERKVGVECRREGWCEREGPSHGRRAWRSRCMVGGRKGSKTRPLLSARRPCSTPVYASKMPSRSWPTYSTMSGGRVGRGLVFGQRWRGCLPQRALRGERARVEYSSRERAGAGGRTRGFVFYSARIFLIKVRCYKITPARTRV